MKNEKSKLTLNLKIRKFDIKKSNKNHVKIARHS